MPYCNLTGDCGLDGLYPNCTNRYGLDLNTTQIIFNRIRECASNASNGVTDWRLNSNNLPTQGGCIAVAGASCPSQAFAYGWAVIWQRLTNWKLPLLQLVALTALPALHWKYKLLVVSRLLGNPISTIQDLVLKLDDCDKRAKTCQEFLSDHGRILSIPQTLYLSRHDHAWEDFDAATAPGRGCAMLRLDESSGSLEEEFEIFNRRSALWKAITIIVVSYDESGRKLGGHVLRSIQEVLDIEEFGGGVHAEFLDICRHTAEALAADRYTTFVPILTAELFFALSIATPFIEIVTNGAVTPGVFLNIEAYSIAFSIQFFCIIFTTILFALIGASQSSDRIPRVLNHFQYNLYRLHCSVHEQIRALAQHEQIPIAPNANPYRRQREILQQVFDTLDRLRDPDLMLPDTDGEEAEAAETMHSQRMEEEPNADTRGARNRRPRRPFVPPPGAGLLYRDDRYCGKIPSWQPFRWREKIRHGHRPTNELLRDGNDDQVNRLAAEGEEVEADHGNPPDEQAQTEQQHPADEQASAAGSESTDERPLLPNQRQPEQQEPPEETSAVSNTQVTHPSVRFSWCSGAFAVTVVSIGYFMGFVIVWEVPPKGFECRHIALLAMYAVWLLSYGLTFLRPLEAEKVYAFDYAKDTTVALALFGAVIGTQCGVLNSCACYTLWGHHGMPLSQFPEIAQELWDRFNTTYAYITFSTLFVYGLIFVVLILYYYDAATVFLQTDNGRPHVKRLRRRQFYRSTKANRHPDCTLRWVWSGNVIERQEGARANVAYAGT